MANVFVFLVLFCFNVVYAEKYVPVLQEILDGKFLESDGKAEQVTKIKQNENTTVNIAGKIEFLT